MSDTLKNMFAGILLGTIVTGCVLLFINNHGKENEKSIFIKTGQRFAIEKEAGNIDKVLDAVYNNARINNLSPYFILSQCWVESEFSQFALSPAGAQGLMQIMVKYWGEQFTDTNMEAIYDIDENIGVGCYIMNCMRQGKGVYRGLIRYNGGKVAERAGERVTVTPESFYYTEKIINTLEQIMIIQGSVLASNKGIYADY